MPASVMARASRRFLPVLDTEAGGPYPGRPVDRYFPDGTLEPQLLHHGDRPKLGKHDHLAVCFYRLWPVICSKALLVLAPLVPGKAHPRAG